MRGIFVTTFALFGVVVIACGDDETPGANGTSSGTNPADGGSSGDLADGSNPTNDSGTSSSSSSGDLPPVPAGCSPLPAPQGVTIVNVNSTQADDLANIVQAAEENTTILLDDGVYKMTVSGEAARRLQFKKKNVTLRSASGKRDAVILDAEYQTNEAIVISASNVTIAHLTITHAIDHPIHVTGSDTASIENTLLYDLHVVDGGEQQIKVNTGGGGTTFVDKGRLECSLIEITNDGRPKVETLGNTSCYTGGIDAHQARGWAVRANVFRGIYCNQFLAEHAIHFWNGSRDTLVERNTIIDCARGVGFGLLESGTSRQYADNPYPGIYVGHYDGVIRNNFISATISQFDTGIELDQSRGTKVHHNTVMHLPSSFSSIDRRFENTLADLQNNLVVKLTTRNEAKGASTSNVENATAALFVDATKGDLHLLQSAATAIDKGTAVTEAGDDIDGKAHNVGAPDVGADEFGAQ